MNSIRETNIGSATGEDCQDGRCVEPAVIARIAL